jgi:choline dehydrogenase-like flavoprotein
VTGAPEHDVAVVGSGPGGAACAWRLATRGLKVLLLEEGPRYDPFNDYLLDKPEWEQSGFPRKVSIAGRQSFAPLQPLDPQWRDLRSWNRRTGPSVRGDNRRTLGYHHVVGLGGSTLHFTGEAHRLHPAAMKMRSRFAVAADWPFDYAALAPFYDIAERVMGVAGPPEDSHRPRSGPYPLPPHAFSYASQKLSAGCGKLGLSFVANARAALSEPYDGRPSCNYCGNCNRGCPRTDKGSADVTFVAKAEATGRCAVRTNVRALYLQAGQGDRVRGVEVLTGKGHDFIPTPALVIACGAVETPRLLLNSGALGNESGEVGRNFMETLLWNSSALHPESLGSYRGLPADGICWDFNAPDAIPGAIGGCRFTNGTAEADLVGPIAYANRVVLGFGRAHKAAMRSAFGRALAVGAIGECLPNADTYIDLDPDKRDAAGLNLARIHSRLDDDAMRRLAFMAKTARAILAASGATEIFEEYGSYDALSATHVSGTCRMGADPEHSVVDPDGCSHRWRNLFISDASTFPSMGGGEAPTLTIAALAIRTADAIAARAVRGEL